MRRLSQDIPARAAAVLAIESLEQPAEALLSDDVQLEPAPAPFQIVQYAAAVA